MCLSYLESFFPPSLCLCRASQVALVVKNSPANAGDIRDMGSIPGLERSPAGGHGNSLRYSYLENATDKGALKATVHRNAKSQIKHLTRRKKKILATAKFLHFTPQFKNFI